MTTDPRPTTEPDLRQRVAARLPQIAWAALAVNILIVVTGGVVRLTGSGLGCDTWPRCNDQSFTPHGASSIHSYIEFGNRLITFLVLAVALLAWAAARWAGRRHAEHLSRAVAALTVWQALVGGIVVLTGLHPLLVGLHLVLSLASISVCAALVRETTPGLARRLPRARDRALPVYAHLAGGILLLAWTVFLLGTLVTGAGPWAGDLDAPRNGLDPGVMAQIHAASVAALVLTTLAMLALVRLTGDDRTRELAVAAWCLLGVELAQGLVGVVQYLSGVPALLVGLHLLGATLVAAASAWVWLAARAVPAVDAPAATPASLG